MAIDDYKVEGENESQELCLVYVKHLGTDIDGTNIYHFYLSENVDDAFGEGWGEVPACNVPRKLMELDSNLYSYVMECKTEMKLDLAQDCCCFSMQDSRDHIVAIAWENLDNAEEYPEPRIILQYGDTVDTLERLFAKRDIVLRYV